MQKRSKILIVEDDEKLRNELEIFLNNNGYEVKTLKRFQNTIEEILSIDPELLLLDINLPETDGEYICREIRKKSNLPIIIITSRDHYITKPFNIQILLAKITSLLRRTNNKNNWEIIDCNQFKINISKNTVIKNKKEIDLTRNEFKILKFLVENRDKIVSREDIMKDLWESESFIDDNTLTVNITRLRNKLEEIGIKELLETKRGQGYILKEK